MKRKKIKKPGRSRATKLALILLFVALLITLPIIWWRVIPNAELTVSVYNKTVPDGKAQQHLALSWFLNQYKYPNEEGLLFNPKNTYLGYHPLKEDPVKDLTGLTDKTDLLYIADTYGIYRSGEGFSRDTTQEGVRNLIWGGASASDASIIRDFLNRERSSTVVSEYNTFATPTPTYVQAQLYEILGTRWTEWTGMYVHDLSVNGETPPWILEQHEGVWNYSGSGIILYNIDDEVIVLRSNIELQGKEMFFSFTEAGNEILGLSGSTKYELLFDVTEPMAGTETLATYTLEVTEQGKALLASYGLTEQFPAVQLKETANHRSYYLGGNWAYSNQKLRFSRISFMSSFMQRFSSKDQRFFWQFYIPMLRAIFQEAEERVKTEIPPLHRPVFHDEGITMVAKATERELLLYDEDGFKPFFVYGVNLGIAMPGRWFTEFPQDKSLYYRFLTQMGELGINTVRIYTLLDPQFYDAFALYNRTHPQRPIYLMQEVWPEEEPEGDDYLREEYQREFEIEIKHVVDAVHGNADIPPRSGRAWGTYTSDVSSYVIGYLVGRELEPHEVEETDALHEGYRFVGAFLGTTASATPTESWLAQCCDYLMAYEMKQYSHQTPVSIVNWPTLDYLEHSSERDEEGKKEREYNDRTTVDINNITLGPLNKAGLFGSYHIYPNYPDFMNNEPAFDEYEDEQGRFRYGGYLRAFMEGHQKYPAVVAEFGIATGMGNAHKSPDGYHHGGLSEIEQAEGIIRMFEAMKREGYSGGIIFEWMDEWAKKTWTTEPYMIPYDRQILWHNAIDPEQNYGLLAFEAVKPKRSGASFSSDSLIRSMELRADVSFLYVDIFLSRNLDVETEQLVIGLDTLHRDRGELKYLPNLDHYASSGMEYIVILDSQDRARLLAIPQANYTNYHFSTAPTLRREGYFESMSKLINKKRMLEDGTIIEALFEDSSALRYGTLVGTTNHWQMQDSSISVRIPWTRINVSDPSSSTVLDDERIYYSDPLRDVIATMQTDAILVSAVLANKEGTQLLDATQAIPIILPRWNQPVYQERMKDSFPLLQAYFSKEHSK